MKMVEVTKRGANLRSPGPTRGHLRQCAQGIRQAERPECVGDLHQFRAEKECVHALEMLLEGVHEAQQKKTIRAHGPADIEKNDEPARTRPLLAVAEVDPLATAADVVTDVLRKST